MSFNVTENLNRGQGFGWCRTRTFLRAKCKTARLSASLAMSFADYIYNTMSFPKIQYAHWLKISCLSKAVEGATKNEVISLRSLALVFPSKRINRSGNYFLFLGGGGTLSTDRWRTSSPQIWIYLICMTKERQFFLLLAESLGAT